MSAKAFLKASIIICIMAFVTFSTPHSGASASSTEFEMASNAIREGRLDNAIKLLDSYIARNPRSYAAHINRGSALFYSGYVFRAVSDWHKAKNLAPLFAYGVFTGEIVWQSAPRGRYLDYVASIELYPDHVATVNMLGVTFLDFGMTDKALELYRKSSELTSNPLFKTDLEWWVYTLNPTEKPRPR